MYYDYYNRSVTVTVPSRDLRALAREALSGKWMKAAVGTFIYTALLSLPQVGMLSLLDSSLAANLYSLIVEGAFTLGYAVFILKIFRGEEAEFAQIFCGFERLGKTICLSLYIWFFTVLWSLLFVIPGIIAAIRYSQSYFILADHPDWSVSAIVNESKRMMITNKAKYFCLNLSFFGWMLLAGIPTGIFESFTIQQEIMPILMSGGGVDAVYEAAYAAVAGFTMQISEFVLNIGYLWLTPYIECACAALYEIIRGNLRPGVIDADAQVIVDETKNIE